MHWGEINQFCDFKYILYINKYEENIFKSTDPLDLPRGIAIWLVWDFEFQNVDGCQCALAPLCRRTGQRASRLAHGDVYFVRVHFFYVVLVYARISFVFFCTCGIIWFVCNDWEWVLFWVFFSLFLYWYCAHWI